ncbi:trimethylamine methyltransferase family protein [Ruminococcaceae bacterium OttesenSCG-928-I18]|nr:trimethylamine methyltransferase family protein [Ruminococcaceae bacterium OttesenSCG-928-I18]
MYTTDSLFRHANYDVNHTVFSQMLSDDQCEEIYVTTLELLERTGVKVTHKEARRVLLEKGCGLEKDIVYLPTAMVEEAIRKAPFRVTLCDRLGKKRVLMETCNSHVGPGLGSEKVLDKDNTIRSGTLADLEKAAVVAEELKQIDFVTPFVMPGDAKGKTARLQAFKALAENSTKPVVMPVETLEEAKALYEMAVLAVGDAGKAARCPYLAFSVRCQESLQHGHDALSVVMFAAEKGIPLLYTADYVSGLTAPYTSAGTLVVALAADLFALTLSQCVKGGAPFILGGKFSLHDEANKATPAGAPEAGLMNFGFANLARYLNLPCACVAGGTDSFTCDAQLGLESTYGIVSACLAGANLVLGGGQMGAGEVFSIQAFALSDEIAALVRRVMRNVEVDEDRIGRGVIGEISPGGNYLGTDHTSLFFKTEQYWPKLQTRKRIDDWLEEGGKPMSERAGDYIEELLTREKANPLSQEQKKGLADVIASY